MAQHGSPLVLARLRAQVVKEILSILRDPRSRMVVFAPPLIQLFIFAFAATLEVTNVGLAVHDQDTGRWSHELVARLDGAGFVSEVHAVRSEGELRQLIDRGDVIAGLNIPADFSRAIAAGDSGRIQVLVDGRRSNAGQIVVGYLS
ncbi:MAG: ABC transporter permease, partial [Gammaproteobacteria bacterium]|nr:ABC transporter permease [Gammaproteobacteria bacterium]